MAEAIYTYSIANDFPPTGLASDRFSQEIRNSAITISLDRVDTDDDVCRIVFKSALPPADETILDGDTYVPAGGLIAAHSGQPLDDVQVSPVILEPTGSSKKSLQIVAFEFEAELNDETEFAIQFVEERDIQGVNLEISNNTTGPNGDEMRIVIQMPDGAGGWVDVRALAQGVGDVPGPVPPSGYVSVVSEGTATMPPVLRILFTYASAATSGDKPLIHGLLRTWL